MRKLAFYIALLLVASIPGTNITLSDAVGSINRLLGILLIVVWLLSLMANGRVRRLHPFHYAALLFSLWYLASITWTIDIGFTMLRTQRLIQSVGLTFILWDLLRTRSDVETCLQAFIIGCYGSVASTLYNYHAGVTINDLNQRFAGSGFDPNDLGILLMIAIPIAWYLALSKPYGNRFLRFLNHVYPLAAVLALFLTGSRGALISCLPALGFVIVTIPRLHRRWRWAFVVLFILGIIGLSRMDLSESLDRFTSIGRSITQEHMTHRTDIWKAGWREYVKDPFFGVGGGAFPTAIAHYGASAFSEGQVAHNSYLSVLTELGAVGLVLFLSVFMVVFRGITKQQGLMRQMWFASFLSMVIGIFSLTWEYRSQTWLLLILIVAASSCSQPQEEAAASASLYKMPAYPAEQSGLAS